MLAYDWPGNIRELKNCIDRMIALSSGPLLHLADLPSNVVQNRYAKAKVEAAAVGGQPMNAAPGFPAVLPTKGVIPLQELERRAIQDALRLTHGDRTEAALLLGIGRTTLYRKLKEYQVIPFDA